MSYYNEKTLNTFEEEHMEEARTISMGENGDNFIYLQ